MKQVSEEYRLSMVAPLRNNSFVRVTLSNVDTSAAADGEWSSNGQLDRSEFATLDYGYDYGATVATLELNRWLLGSNQIIRPATPHNDGFISSKISSQGGTFGETPALTRTFFSPHILPGLTLVFDTRTDEWPRSFTVTYYLGATEVLVVPLSNVQSNTVVVAAPTTAVDGFVIEFWGMLPRRRPRVEQVLYGAYRRFENREISQTQQAHDVDPLTRRPPNETFSVTIFDPDRQYDFDNPSGIYALVDENSPIELQHGYELPNGTIEWLKPDKYLLNAKPSSFNFTATFSGTGLLQSLTRDFRKGRVGLKNFYDMAEEVLLDAGLFPSPQGENPWVIDESLRTMTTFAVLPIEPHMNCLQMIAHACRCRLFTDDDNIIHITPFSPALTVEDAVFTLNFRGIRKDGQRGTKIDPLRAVNVSRYQYIAGTSTMLYQETTTATFVEATFSSLAQNATVQVTGGTLVSSEIYGRAADITLSAGTKTITITGIPLDESSVVVSNQVSDVGEVDEVDNPLITEDSMCVALGNHIAAYLAMRNTYDVDYRGNPELETGDVLALQTAFSDEVGGLILTNEITFNGSLDGKLKVKKLL